MGLLDDLKKRVAAKEAQVAARPAEPLRVTEFRAVALPALTHIYRNLSELVTQLRALQEETPATLTIPGIGAVAGFLQGGYDVSADGVPPRSVTLRCTLRQPKPRRLEYRIAGLSTTVWLERLRQQGLQARALSADGASNATPKSYVEIHGGVPASLEFTLDFDNAALQLNSRNFEELIDRRQYFSPANVTEAWCEELLKFVMRAENSFMRYELPPDLREQLRRRIEWEREQGRDVAAGNRLRPLRVADIVGESGAERVADDGAADEGSIAAPRLKIAYRYDVIEIVGLAGAFIIGRASDCNLCVEESRVSKQHARIEMRADGYHLIDVSRNGTHVRFHDGRVELLHQSSIVLRGSGMFGLGTKATSNNPHVIHFSA